MAGGGTRGSGGGAWRPRSQHASPFGHFPEHVAGVGVGKVGAGLGQIWADLDLRPKTKFEDRELLYIFYLETKVIRAFQQRVIKPQTASVSVLTAASKRSN